jgi:hypothetical protein
MYKLVVEMCRQHCETYNLTPDPGGGGGKWPTDVFTVVDHITACFNSK